MTHFTIRVIRFYSVTAGVALLSLGLLLQAIHLSIGAFGLPKVCIAVIIALIAVVLINWNNKEQLGNFFTGEITAGRAFGVVMFIAIVLWFSVMAINEFNHR